MKDYKESLLAGIAAAKKAEDNRNEVKEVLDDLDRQIRNISGDKAGFGIATFFKEDDSHLSVGVLLTQGRKREQYKGLAIFDYNQRNGIEIAEWIQNDSGYPCTIRYRGQKLFCSNKNELENALASLLRDVKTGEAILEQINRFDQDAKPIDEEPV